MSPSPSAVLVCHPASPCAAVSSIGVDVTLTAGGLAFAFRLSGDPAGIVVPAPRPPGPADGLWQHTCCEAFVAVAGSSAYREFNFSPSRQWAAYAFSGYRQREDFFSPVPAPEISLRRLADGFALDAVVAPALLPPAAPGAGLELGLSMVVEAADGSRSYWALAHAGEQPDFHRHEAFTLTLGHPGNRSTLQK